MEANRRFFSKIGFNYFALGIIVLVLNLFIGLFISMINPNLLSNQTMMTFFSAIWTYLLPLPIFIYIMRKTEAKTLEKHKMTVKTFVICISITMFLMWIGNIMGVIITSGIGSLIQHEVANPIHDVINNSGLVANLIIITTIAPIFEELIFRKLLIDRTIKYGGTISVLLSGLLFAFFHGNLNQFFYAFLLGGFFAIVYIKTGQIKYTIGLHMIINFIGSVVSLFVSQPLMDLANGSVISPTSTFGVILYILITLGLTVMGLIYSIKYFDKSQFDGSEKEIILKNPVSTILLNPGIICFILLMSYTIFTSIA
ncbi:CAAX amino terminal protease family protein [Methanobrevibacter smithii DSM 2375]|uniref:CAAX amino terminal protease family protein n=1 Tax=Methanobrevibacter smithii DSM 2375 TaxID=483214 RepID=B9ACK0_METSM|nr:type II CAAX endopeptidase family protein [Methanobrevibacter smithii]EEE41190.1 CAAX amino terminal protease family protein [Methanobrevibacter smithii DSM 2375]